MLYSNILETVGNTPVVKLNRIGPKDVNVYVKIESFNPMGSVKDRLARNVIEQAEIDGTLRPRQTIIGATSGNTGIALAMVCAVKGVTRVLKKESPDTKIIVCEPNNSQLLGSGIPQERLWRERSRSQKKRRPAPTYFACFPTPVNAT